MSSFCLSILGVFIGSAITLMGQWLKHRWENSEARNRDNGRKTLLRQMLDNPGLDGWRKMTTMSRVIGATRDETARLLIDVGARASETEVDVWAYLKNKPLPHADGTPD
jgi:hypothetical protein